MKLTVKDVLQLFQDQAIRLVAGAAGIENKVNSVNIMDAPDIFNWVKPGELVLTTAYTIKDDPCLQEQLVRELSRAGSAGLGIKTRRFLPEIPAIMIHTADELGFPLLELPLEISLAEIMNPVISSIAARQAYLLQQSNEIHRTLTKEAINGGGLDMIIQRLGKLTQCPVACYDTKGLPLSSWLPASLPGIDPGGLAQIAEHLRHKPADYGSLQQQLSVRQQPLAETLSVNGQNIFQISFAVMSSNDFFGHIAIVQPTDSFLDINCIALEHACTVAALDFLKQKAVNQSRRLRTRDILEHILFGDLSHPATVEMIGTSKFSQAKYFQCLILAIDDVSGDVNIPIVLNRLYQLAQQMIAAPYPLSLIAEHTGQLIVLVAAQTSLETTEIHARLLNSCEKLYKNITISIGVGTPVTLTEQVRISYQAAVTCLKTGRMIKGPGTLTYPYEAASYCLLEPSGSLDILDQACQPYLVKLERYDRLHGSELLQTLEQYLENDKSMTDTSEALFIHRNTLANRLEKIMDVTGFDLSNRELMFNLRLALRRRRTLPADGGKTLKHTE